MFAKQYKKYEKHHDDLIKDDDKASIRLNLYISKTGVASRRGADSLIEHGRIKVNGVKALLGMQITKNDVVTLDNNIIEPLEEKILYIT